MQQHARQLNFLRRGTINFAYFRLINASQHSSYEVDFVSNYPDEPLLKYCVSAYCQQGWDPKTTVSLMSKGPTGASAAGVAHITDCGEQQPPVKRRSKQ
jgi:hypothetical protein